MCLRSIQSRHLGTHFGSHKSRALLQRFAAEVSGPLMADRGARPNIIYVEMLAQHCNTQNGQ